MPVVDMPVPAITLSKIEARRFMLGYHKLLPPRSDHGKSGVLDYLEKAGCIQFDPINLVGRNPDLVLQSRIENYQQELLEELLYVDRVLVDGWDKVASIYSSRDRRYFARHRALMEQQHGERTSPAMKIADRVIEEIRVRGALSSLEFKDTERLKWSWGQSSSLAKATLEALFAMGRLGIHHRVNNRRYFDLIERLLPEEILMAGDPNQTEEQYHDWHVLRRVGGLGLACAHSGDSWLGILGVKSLQRRAALSRLVSQEKLIPVEVDGLERKQFFLPARAREFLESAKGMDAPQKRAAVIAPLDNIIWDRKVLEWLFDYQYTWEVYKPAAKRKYGYYVLPVLYGDRFVARFEPGFDKASRELTIKGWWWEDGVEQDQHLGQAMIECFSAFGNYLNVSRVSVEEGVLPDSMWFDQIVVDKS